MYKFLVVAAFFACSFSAYSQKTFEYKSPRLNNLGCGFMAFKSNKFIGFELSRTTFYIPQSQKTVTVGFISFSPEIKIGKQLTTKWHNLTKLRLDIGQDVVNYTLGSQFVHTGNFVFKTNLPIQLGIDWFNSKLTYIMTGDSKRTNFLHFFGGISLAKRIKISNNFYVRPSIQTNFKSFLELVDENDKSYQFRVVDYSNSSVNLALLYHQLYFEFGYGQQSNYYGDKIGNQFNFRNKMILLNVKYLFFNDLYHLPKFIF